MSAAEHPSPSHAEAVTAQLERLRQVAVNVQAEVGAAIDESAVAALGDPAVMHVVEALRQVERAAYRAARQGVLSNERKENSNACENRVPRD